MALSFIILFSRLKLLHGRVLHTAILYLQVYLFQVYLQFYLLRVYFYLQVYLFSGRGTSIGDCDIGFRKVSGRSAISSEYSDTTYRAMFVCIQRIRTVGRMTFHQVTPSSLFR